MFCCGGSKKPTKQKKKDEPIQKVEKSHSQSSVVISERSVKSLSHVVKWAKDRNLFEEYNVSF